MKKTTLKEIAEALHISITTVSKALKNYKDVNPETKRLIVEKAKELNYKPNVFAVNLRTKESKTIGIIIPEVVHHFFSSVLKGIISKAEKKGYLVIILQSNESYEMEKKQIDLLINKRVDGILISLANETRDFQHLNEIMENDIPLVMFDKIAKLVKCNKVVINDREAAYTATQHLIDLGCKKIAHFRGPLLPQNSIDRFLGYKKALQNNGLTFDHKLVYLLSEMSFEEGKTFAKQMIAEHPDVDGVFVNTDLVAVGVITELNAQKIEIPNQIKVIGFSNWFMSAVISPSLSTIDQPGFKMGKTAFKLLYDEISTNKKGQPYTPKTVELKTDLIIRKSTQKSFL